MFVVWHSNHNDAHVLHSFSACIHFIHFISKQWNMGLQMRHTKWPLKRNFTVLICSRESSLTEGNPETALNLNSVLSFYENFSVFQLKKTCHSPTPCIMSKVSCWDVSQGRQLASLRSFLCQSRSSALNAPSLISVAASQPEVSKLKENKVSSLIDHRLISSKAPMTGACII